MSVIDYHIKNGEELLANKDRIRNLVKHWGEDGRYKEVILKNLILKFLPSNLGIATGFVVFQDNDMPTHQASTQIDLIIYDLSHPTLFKESDFVIVMPDSVRGIIEVKANLKNYNLEDVISKSNTIGQLIYANKKNKNALFFNGVFSYEGYEKGKMINFETPIINASNKFITDPTLNNYRVNHICFNKDLYYKFWTGEYYELTGQHYIHKVERLSFSYFVSNLLFYVADDSESVNSRLLFPANDEMKVMGKFK
jgi:hypothetical protein